MKQRLNTTEPGSSDIQNKSIAAKNAAMAANQSDAANYNNLIDDSILDGITQKSKQQDDGIGFNDRPTRRNQVNTAKASFRHKSVQNNQAGGAGSKSAAGGAQDASKIHSLY